MNLDLIEGEYHLTQDGEEMVFSTAQAAFDFLNEWQLSNNKTEVNINPHNLPLDK